jgi:hypothetical protein
MRFERCLLYLFVCIKTQQIEGNELFKATVEYMVSISEEASLDSELIR